MAVCQNLVPLVNIKIAGKWMFIPLKMVLIGIDPYPYDQYWLVVWIFFSIQLGIIIPTDELHHFSGGVGIPPQWIKHG